MTDSNPATAATSAPPAAIPTVPTKLGPAVAAALGASLVGAVLWAVITVETKYQIGFMAIGVGFLVGWAVHKTGRSGAPVLGYIGAAFALFGCLLGNLLTIAGMVSADTSTPLTPVVAGLLLHPDAAASAMGETFDAMDLVFYAIAVYEGYKIGRRPSAA